MVNVDRIPEMKNESCGGRRGGKGMRGRLYIYGTMESANMGGVLRVSYIIYLLSANANYMYAMQPAAYNGSETRPNLQRTSDNQ